ncbi:MAG: hypothetical protein LBD01_02970 [Puniceicoccales bacterium]|jgi:tetratricopeptide (TPR) repeat protein|nr:hypothetical protein [Puniceicoccales bacterium]
MKILNKPTVIALGLAAPLGVFSSVSATPDSVRPAPASGLESNQPAPGGLQFAPDLGVVLPESAATTGGLTAALVDPASKFAEPDPSLLFLTGIPDKASPQEIVAYARRSYAYATTIHDPLLRQIIRFSLAKLEDAPATHEEVRRQHLEQLGNYFHSVAVEMRNKKDPKGMLNAIELAVRCNPANVDARVFFANILARTGKGADAVVFLRDGFSLVRMDNPSLARYTHEYLQLLGALQRDRDVLAFADVWLQQAKLPSLVRATVMRHAVVAANFLGDYDRTLQLIRSSEWKTSQAVLFEARALFYKGETVEAIKLLNAKIPRFADKERDALLSQQARFYNDLGRTDYALAVMRRRIHEFPANPQPRIHRLHLLSKTGQMDAFARELKDLRDKFSSNLSAMLALAAFASERGRPDIAEGCYETAGIQRGVFLDKTTVTNRQSFAALLIESYIRARQAPNAIAAYKRLQAVKDLHADDPQGTVHALLAAACFAQGDAPTARRHLDEFFFENHASSEARALINAKLRQKATLSTEIAREAIDKEIEQLTRSVTTRHARRISAEVALAVARLLRFTNAPNDALRVLERSLQETPGNSQLRADYILTRIQCGAVEPSGPRKDLAEDVEALLAMRRPAPGVWMEIKKWLDADTRLPSDKAGQLRERVGKLVRKDLVGIESEML